MANTTYNIDIQVQSKSLGQLEEELSQINAELKQVKVGSQAFKELSKRSQDVTKDLEKVNTQIKGFTAEDKFTAANGAVKLLAGSLAGVVGTLGLIGVESEALGEMEKKAASAIAAAIGFKDVAEGLKDMRTALKGVTKAQIANNIAVMANPYVLAAAALVTLTLGLAKYASMVTGDVVPVTTTLTNMFRSMGSAAKFAALQAEATAEGLTKIKEVNDALELDRAIAVSQAFGKDTIDLEIKRQKKVLEKLKEGSEEYYKEFTKLSVLRAKKRVIVQDKEVEEEEAARAKKMAELQLKWALSDEAAEVWKMYGEDSGDEMAIAFAAAFEKTIKKELDPRSIVNIDMEEEMFLFDFQVEQDKLKTAREKELDERDRAAAQMNQIATDVVSNIDSLQQAAFERQMSRLEQERNEILNNSKLTEKEKMVALNKVAKEEKRLQTIRIKQERDTFTIKQGLLLASLAAEAALAAAKAGMSIGAYVSQLGPLGIAAYAASIGGILATIISARKNAKSQISALGGGSSPSGGSIGSSPQIPSVTTQSPQAPPIVGCTKTYVLSGDVTSAQEADARLSTKRSLG